MLPYQRELQAGRRARRIADEGQAVAKTTWDCRDKVEKTVDRRTTCVASGAMSRALFTRPPASGGDRFRPVATALFRRDVGD